MDSVGIKYWQQGSVIINEWSQVRFEFKQWMYLVKH